MPILTVTITKRHEHVRAAVTLYRVDPGRDDCLETLEVLNLEDVRPGAPAREVLLHVARALVRRLEG